VLCLYAAPAAGQALPIDHLTPALPTLTERKVADVVSWLAVGTALALDTWASAHADDKKRAFGLQGVRVGVTWASAATVKKLVHRQRPCAPNNSCGSDQDDASFYSLHEAFTCQARGGPGKGLMVGLSIGTGLGRILANKHFLTDVAAGCGAGLLVSLLR